MTSAIYCYVTSVIVIHSYKILLFLLYIAYHSFMWVAIASIKMCLLINYINKCVGEYKIAWKVDIAVGLMFHIRALKEFLNLYNKNQQMHMYKECFIAYY
jgi:hypothetical protein